MEQIQINLRVSRMEVSSNATRLFTLRVFGDDHIRDFLFKKSNDRYQTKRTTGEA